MVAQLADDNLFATLRLYERNYTSKGDTIRALKTYKLEIKFHFIPKSNRHD